MRDQPAIPTAGLGGVSMWSSGGYFRSSGCSAILTLCTESNTVFTYSACHRSCIRDALWLGCGAAKRRRRLVVRGQGSLRWVPNCLRAKQSGPDADASISNRSSLRTSNAPGICAHVHSASRLPVSIPTRATTAHTTNG